MKYIIAILLLVVAFFGYRLYQAPTTDKSDSVVAESLQVQQETDAYKIDVNILPSGISKIDTAIALANEIELIEFKSTATTSELAQTSAPFELTKTSKKFISSDILKLDTIVITRYEYIGGAHGNVTYDTYTFGREKGLAYGIDNILRQSPELDVLITQRTIAMMQQVDELVDTSSVASVVSDWNNLENFYLDSDTLVLLFEPYIVGPHALGTQTVRIPMQELLPYTRGAIGKAYGYTTPNTQATSSATTTVN